MNILLLNHYAGSKKLGMEFRPYYMAYHWKRLGHNPTIVAANYSHLRLKQPKESGWENIDDIDYLWLKTNRYKGNGIKRVISMLLFVLQLFALSWSLSKKVKPNVVIASSTYPLDIFPAWIIAKLSKAKLAFEIHDLWPLSPMELGGMSKWHPFIMIMRFGEWFAFKVSDKIISIPPCAYEHVKKDGVPKNKFAHIPNGINLVDYKKITPLPLEIQKQISQKKKEKYSLIGYAGSVGIANAMDTFVNAAKLLKREKIAFFVLGDGPELHRFRKRSEELQLDNIFFLGKVERLAVHTFLTEMDVLYVGAKKTKLYKFGISFNKIFDYMMAGKPIIQAISAGNDLIQEADCGFTIQPEDLTLLATTIKRAFNLSPTKLEKMGKNGKAFVMKNHDYKVLAKRFIEALT